MADNRECQYAGPHDENCAGCGGRPISEATEIGGGVEAELNRAWGVAEHFADQLVENWHESGDEEKRELHEYMGLSFAAYSRYVENIRLMSVPAIPPPTQDSAQPRPPKEGRHG